MNQVDAASGSSVLASDEIKRMYWIHAHSPLHVGSGKGAGFIDLPIAREKVTGWPYVPGSAVKGVLADKHGVTEVTRQSGDHKIAFGGLGSDASSTNLSNSGSLVFTDARIVCLPVRSLYGTFAWCASPMGLQRLARDLTQCGLQVGGIPSVGQSEVVVPDQPVSCLVGDSKVYFEDLDFTPKGESTARAWSKVIGESVFDELEWQSRFEERFALVDDDVFNFLCETATQVDARIAINAETKTVKGTALWYEESLPAESILAGVVWCGPVFGQSNRHDKTARERVMSKFCSDATYLQVGGKATVGRGQVRLTFHDGSAPGGVRMTQIRTRQQLMAEAAFTLVRAREKEKLDDQYASFAKSFPALIHSAGLCQAVAFAQAKSGGSDGRKAPGRVLDDLVALLVQCNETRPTTSDQFAEKVRGEAMVEYMRLSRVTLLAATWIKRYTEALGDG